MKQFFYVFVFLFLVSCKSKDGLVSSPRVQDGEVVVVEGKKALLFNVGMLNEPDKADLLFSIRNLSLADKQLKIDVQYAGGCVRPHVFELVTDGIIDTNGNMAFQLLHRTHNDFCKALIMETLVFDFSSLYQLNSEKLKTFTINQQGKVTF